FVEGEGPPPAEFAKALGSALEEMESELPRGKVGAGASSQIQQARSLAELKKAAGEPIDVFGSRGGTHWTVILENEPGIALSPLYRTIRVKPISRLEEAIGYLEPWKAHLQAAGISVSDARRESLSRLLGRAGFHRICPLGKMQAPPVDWPQDGHRFVADRVRWVDLEKQ
ncbi:MAG TPA: acyl-CoA reductase, partial [Nitrospiria bacterium]|nr:acyl-CoA reductase [Nitrospiria bacterium]